MKDSRANLKRPLHHVLWIGGPPDSGKTSVADLIASRHGLQTYHFDRHEPAHFARADSARHPALYAAHPDRMSPEERWISQSPEAMAESTIACWTERFFMAVDDLLAMPSTPMIMAEGPGFFPECVFPLIADPHQAVWLVPTETFKRTSVARREKLRSVPTSDPERAIRNLIERDLLMGEHVWNGVRELGLAAYEVDGTGSLEEVAAIVEEHFAPWLPDVETRSS